MMIMEVEVDRIQFAALRLYCYVLRYACLFVGSGAAWGAM
jgi:hypothetical protein